MVVTKHVLVVEDVEEHALLIQRAFEEDRGSYEVEHVRTLKDARSLLRVHNWDLILADLRLPDGHGTDLLDDDELQFCPPIIVMTSHGDQNVAVDAMKSGALDYVVKSPETLSDISHIAEHALREWGHIVDRIQADEALRDSEGRYRMLAENSPDIVLRYDREHRYVYANAEAERSFGIQAEEFYGKTNQELGFPVEMCQYWDQMVSRVFEMGRLVENNYELETGGKLRTYNWRLVPEVGTDNTVETVLSIARDLTEHLEMQGQLRRTEERYRILFETMMDGFSLHEKVIEGEGKATDFRYVEVNPAYEKILGVKADEIVGRTIREVMPEFEDRWLGHCVDVASSGRSVRFQQYLPKLGKHLDVMVFSPHGEQLATVVADITEKVHLEDRLRHSEKMQAIGQLAGGVAHDFNNQLACIMGFADLLRARLVGDDDLRRYAEMIVNASARSADLTKQLLAFARKGQYRTVDIDVHQLITELVSLLEHTLSKKIRIDRDFCRQSPTVTGDPSQLQNAMLNIALNAGAAMPDGGTLTFMTSIVELSHEFCDSLPDEVSPGRYLQVSIIDDGTGMSEAIQSRIFEPFFTTKAPGEGTGMGLAAVYGTVRNHHGAVVVESEEGKGSTFSIYLPLKDEVCQLSAERADDEPEDTKRGQGGVLVVDDEEMVRYMADELLQDLGYAFWGAPNGEEALVVYEENRDDIDLVILDMSMPGLSGRDTFVKLKEMDPKVKAVISSGYGMDGEIQEAINEGVLEFIQKPFQVAELSRVMDQFV